MIQHSLLSMLGLLCSYVIVYVMVHVMVCSFQLLAHSDHPYIVLSLQQVIPVLFSIFKKCFIALVLAYGYNDVYGCILHIFN